jgi:transposase|tara:strand:- start:14 stop:1183 length:1170 start_codon:yes stop_codon:yes gene_type:complete
MNAGRIVFAQLAGFLPMHEFRKCIDRYHGEYKVHNFSCRDQLLCMAFAQLTGRESLREIETCLRAMHPKLYHAGIRGKVSRSTLADANEKRNYRIYAELAQVLIARARVLYGEESFGVELEQTAYALDSTTIDLCLSLFHWARFRKHKGAVKLHTLMDLRGSIPCLIRITDGKTHDVHILDELIVEAGAFYIMDRAYTDFARLYGLSQALGFFITRAKKNLDYSLRSYRLVDKTTGLRSDQTIVLRGPKSSQRYPAPLRRITYFDLRTRNRLVFLTNNFRLPPLTVAQLYKCRWQVELFFKWIKQHLRIKSFLGTSPNAVKTQIWIAISVYVLVAIVKKELRIERSLSEILQILSICLFEKVPLHEALRTAFSENRKPCLRKQLPLFDL